MRLEQLEYLEMIVKTGSFNEAAKRLFMTQPSLSSAIKKLEEELSIKILLRTKTGVSLTADGREFMSYSRQVLEQVELLRGRYKKNEKRKKSFSVSAQHYAFVVNAFVELLRGLDVDEYNFTLRETETQNIFDDLNDFKSELGILYLNSFNSKVLQKIMLENDLEFQPLFIAKPHIFVGYRNPLTKKKCVNLADLEDYPYLSYEQEDANSFFFAEEVLSTIVRKKNIKVSDRATIFNLMAGVNGYTISSGIISSDLNDDKIVAIPLNVNDSMTLGLVKHKQLELSLIAQQYLQILKRHIRNYGFKIINENK
ncbi:LysR family transcriptional regulator [Liquorilactobacillus capillatus]|uniref:LysR family transcriptional regulator n=1 Tax=Liquorilactobacillus capillatus DSM 19910 TaxID=1423731 RepID=A0A0R1LXN0_9LACO|nr:LysR family transcriptional regulator [Liquorilactobacillus capillatus]KRL00153.1 LysR family transcriptional regulator [Liquorilactobacillus capillatus DSM 19910]